MAAFLKDFTIAALKEDQRIDGRRPFDSRRLNIKFSREDGFAEVQLGQTLVTCGVTCQLVQPFPERPNEGSLTVFTDFSPMADSTFEPGRQGENAVELGRVIDRGLRESRAVDTESLCVVAGKTVWALRVDISVLDNGGNLIDAASIAALAALLSFRRPECSVGGEDGQEIVIHPPEEREPLPLILHHLPIAVTFAFFGDGDLVVMDPSYKEETVMKGRLTIILNIHGDICAIQKGGGVGVSSGEIMRCMRIASSKVIDITSTLKKAAEAHETERAFRKVKRHKTLSVIESRKVEITKTFKADVKMRDAVLERAIKPKGELTDSEDSSSEDSEDDTDSEEEMPAPTRVIRHEVAHSMVSVKTAFQGGASNWEEESTTMLVETSAGMPSESSPSIKSHSNTLNGKPSSLKDAVKNNMKQKKQKKKMGKQALST